MSVTPLASVFSSPLAGRAGVRTCIRPIRMFVITAGAQFRPTVALGPRCVVRLCSAVAVIILRASRTVYVVRRRTWRLAVYPVRCRTGRLAVHPVIAPPVLRFRMW